LARIAPGSVTEEGGPEAGLVDGEPGAVVVDDEPGTEVVEDGTGMEVLVGAPGREEVVVVVGLLAAAAPGADERARTSTGATQTTRANRRSRLPLAMPNRLPYLRG
jgi:hypothetical protein